MITFKEYVEKVHYANLPKVLFGIRTEENLTEEIHVPSYTDYIGPEDKEPTKLGYKRVFRGIYSHPDHPDKHFLFLGADTPTVVNKGETSDEIDEADDHLERFRENRKAELKDVSDRLTKHYDPDLYSEGHKNSIATYTDVGSMINHRLLRGETNEHHENHILHLDSAMNVRHTPDDMVVYSGTSDMHAQKLRTHEMLHHPSYLSSSVSLEKAVTFARSNDGDVVKIHIPKGHPGVFPGHMSRVPGERELIIPRNTIIHIDHSKRQLLSHDLIRNRKVYIHHATIK